MSWKQEDSLASNCAFASTEKYSFCPQGAPEATQPKVPYGSFKKHGCVCNICMKMSRFSNTAA